MEVGRKLDALIVEKIFGCKVAEVTIDSNECVFLTEPGKDRYSVPRSSFTVWKCHCDPIHIHNCDNGQIPNYSTDIRDAFNVVNELDLLNGAALFCETSITDPNKCEWIVADVIGGREFSWHGNAGETAPHAICLAALKAVGQ